ncbi:co-chaperone GroES [Candidatus Pacearchaeota archaeon]|nr:co-chaperone GroES [Candidatus Pacearchaeota archaeon]
MLQPINDRIVVKKIDAPELSQGGIHLPTTAQEDILRGTVLAVGSGRTEAGKLMAMTVKVGDTIATFGGAGQRLKIDGQEVIVMSEGDILGILKGGQ